MDVRVTGVDGAPIADDCLVSVKVGDVQKQALYNPQRLYRFKDVKRVAQIEVYKQIGSCDIAWDSTDHVTKTCVAEGSGGSTGIPLSVDVGPLTGNEAAKDRPGKSVSAEAKAYVKDHAVQELLTNAMAELLKVMPQDPNRFLAEYISKRGLARRLMSDAPLESSTLVSVAHGDPEGIHPSAARKQTSAEVTDPQVMNAGRFYLKKLLTKVAGTSQLAGRDATSVQTARPQVLDACRCFLKQLYHCCLSRLGDASQRTPARDDTPVRAVDSQLLNAGRDYLKKLYHCSMPRDAVRDKQRSGGDETSVPAACPQLLNAGRDYLKKLYHCAMPRAAGVGKQTSVGNGVSADDARFYLKGLYDSDIIRVSEMSRH